MPFRQIASYDNYLVANIALGLLQDNNISCHLKDEYTITVDPLLSSAIGGIKLMIHEVHWDRAVDVLKTAEKIYLQQIACPHCANNSLIVYEEVRSPKSFFQKIKNKILLGQNNAYKKNFLCKTCNVSFSELPSTLNN